MKKIIPMLLPLLVLCGALAACGSDGGETTAASTEDTTAAATEAADLGEVRFWNMDPDMDEAWKALAAQYAERTGVEVTVISTDSPSLPEKLGEEESPTLFLCGIGPLAGREAELLDLTGAAACSEMTTDAYNLTDEAGAVKALAAGCETVGIIVNKTLLEQAGHSLEEIVDFASLKFVAEEIHARAEELGFDAFTAPGLAEGSAERFTEQLYNIPLYYEFQNVAGMELLDSVAGTYLMAYRNIWDLYLANSSAAPGALTDITTEQALAEFGQGKAVFHQGGSWDYETLCQGEYGMDSQQLEMIPIYCGADGESGAGLSTGAVEYWAVSAQADRKDTQATLDFLYWVVSSQAGLEILSGCYSQIPYKNAAGENPFCADAQAYADQGYYNVDWVYPRLPADGAGAASAIGALAAYAQAQTDENWAAAAAAFTQSSLS